MKEKRDLRLSERQNFNWNYWKDITKFFTLNEKVALNIFLFLWIGVDLTIIGVLFKEINNKDLRRKVNKDNNDTLGRNDNEANASNDYDDKDDCMW